jgi:hypothetical protein
VLPHPFEVGLDRADQLLERGVEVVLEEAARRNELELAELRR